MTSVDPRLTKLFGAAARVCALHDHELGEPGRAEAIEILRETVNAMSPLTAERAGAEPVAWRYHTKNGWAIEPLYAAPPAGSDAIDAARWLDIETAPRDKTMVALLHVHGNYRKYGVGWYMPMDGWQGWESAVYVPTHWMPLPEPPNTARTATPASGAGEAG